MAAFAPPLDPRSSSWQRSLASHTIVHSQVMAFDLEIWIQADEKHQQP